LKNTVVKNAGSQEHTCNPSTWETEAEDCEFKACLGYIGRPYLKNNNNEEYRLWNQSGFTSQFCYSWPYDFGKIHMP
jgi:hypothetical protein